MTGPGFRVFCGLFAASLLAGCATAPQGNPSDPLAEANSHFTGTVVTAAAIGCVAGAILGAVLDGGKGAALGCGALGAAGAGAGYLVARNNVAQARTETGLRGEIDQANQDATDAKHASAYAWRQTYLARAETASLRRQVSDGQITQADYQSRISGYRHSSAEMKSLIKNIATREASYRTAAAKAPPAQAQELNAATARLDSERVSLVDSYNAMQQALAAQPAS